MNYRDYEDSDPIRFHEGAIVTLRDNLAEMKAGTLRHYRQGPNGRLDLDDTEHMMGVTRADIRSHQECLALARHYAGAPLVWPASAR